MTDDRAAFYNYIASSLAQNPDWLGTALAGVSDGMAGALREANKRAGLLDMGLRCALGLADPGRLTADTKAILVKGVLNALPPDEQASEIERKARARLSHDAS